MSTANTGWSFSPTTSTFKRMLIYSIVGISKPVMINVAMTLRFPLFQNILLCMSLEGTSMVRGILVAKPRPSTT